MKTVPTQPDSNTGADQPGTPTCNHERGTCALRATGTAVFTRILTAHIPKQQLCHTPPLP